jgi:hypothetical protein
MKITVLSFHCVAAWKWNASTEPHQLYTYAERGADGQILQGDDEDDDEVCGICQSAFESTCPDCKVPGDDCPLSRLSRELANSSLGRMLAHLSYALPTQVARDRVVQAAMPDG